LSRPTKVVHQPGDRGAAGPQTRARSRGSGRASWLEVVLHPLDRDRFRAVLDSVLEQRRGRLQPGFPPAHARRPLPSGFALKARPGWWESDGEGGCGSWARSPTSPSSRNAEERLLHDAVHDNLTGLPNRELFLDRLEGVLTFAKADPAIKPTVDRDRSRPLQAGQRFPLAIAVGDFDSV